MVLVPPYTDRPKKLPKATPKDLVAYCVLMLRSGVILGHLRLRRAALDRSSSAAAAIGIDTS
jgi:hypothetical protein